MNGGAALDQPTRGTRRARWGMLATVVVMAAALVGTGVTTYVDHSAASDAMASLRAKDLFRAVVRNLRMSDDPSGELDAILTDFAEAGLRYVALVTRRGDLVASAGKSRGTAPVEALPFDDLGPTSAPSPRDPRLSRVGDRLRLDAPIGGPGMGGMGPGRGGRPHPRVLIEVEPIGADELAERARGHLVVSLVAAVSLLVMGLVFWRMSRRQERVEALLAKNRRLAALGEMSAVLGHELRNPLAALKGHAQLVVERLEPEARARRSAERVVHEAMRLEALTTQVLDFARTGALDRAEHAPAEVLTRAVEEVGAERVRLDVAAAPARWSLDATRMQQVLVNLLQNAAAAAPAEAPAAPSPIDARCAADGADLVYVVRDRGPGFPPGELEHAFEPFRTHRIHGTGLGLAIARRIVEAHGGTLTARNVPLPDGGGAEVCARLPAVAPAPRDSQGA